MSVTFTPEIEPTGFDVTDGEGGRERHATREAAYARVAELETTREPLRGCTDPEAVRTYGAYLVEPVHGDQEIPWVNASNANARHLLRLLGLLPGLDAGDVVGTNDSHEVQTAGEDDLWGEESCEQFLGRTLLALATPTSAGVPARTIGPRMIDCGRAEGYDSRRLTQLHDLAVWALEHGASRITWA
ncbi:MULTISPECIES: hypothetical protein [Rhodococcus]|uniref:hypothetical protein n=1 Tax=Rhodococcus TaxID=1827 RepID=UPI00110E7D13|nr:MULTISPECIES: hypothetical protein [Rhodococcus]MBX4171194.1 hypothetical protein [Rhodococcus sp. DMU2021]MDJ0401458.1 hypothetical protein [Rhodococcus rhodochrous]QXF84008.1 hypothetical protein HBA53_23090 [Rhodococcus pyridinivorans]